MRLLLIHLSDLHITGSHDPILSRANAVADAVKNLDYSLDLCVVAITGDLAFAGKENQYLSAWDFLLEIKTLLAEKLSSTTGAAVPIHFVAIPGNHDCDFEGNGGVRDMVIMGVLKNQTRVNDPSVVQTCTIVQSKFFEFLSVFANEGFKDGAKIDGRYENKLYYEYHLEHHAQSIRFICCNTSWLSQLKEEQGQLFYPPDAIPHSDSHHELNVVLFHHPYNWLENVSARSFRKSVEKVADLILTGHEHDATRRTQQGEGGEFNTYVEGGALQDAEDHTRSYFNSFVIDTSSKKHKFARWNWNGERFVSPVELPEGNEGSGLSWVEFPVNQLRHRARFELTEDTKRNCDDPGITLTHRGKGDIKLSDIFVYPDLRDCPVNTDVLPSLVKGDRLVDFIAKKSHLLLIGDHQAGKTSLAKTLFLRFYEGGSVPILVSGDIRPHTDDRLFGYIEDLFARQYEKDALDAYRQMDRSQRVIIIDDYHKLQLTPSTKKKFLAQLAKFAGRILLLGNELALIEDIATSVGSTAEVPIFTPYRIQPFGYRLRNRLVEKWLLIGSETDTDDGPFMHQLTTVTRLLDTLIGKNFVPAYPVYLLSILQASEAATPVDITASTHGYFYELLIRITLARGKTQLEYDLTASYLSYLAHSIFKEQLREIDEDRFRKIHGHYELAYDVTVPFEQMRDSLIERHMVTRTSNQYKFKYRYLYYFFVAAHMRDHIHSAETIDILKRLSGELYKEESANILLFLAHLSKDPAVVNEMLGAAREHFRDFSPSRFTDDTVFLNKLEQGEDQLIFKDKDPKKTREEMYESLDQAEDEVISDDLQPEFTDPASPVAKINAAIKTLQILGQILKNFPGSIEGDVKFEIAKECTYLGMRVNGAFLGFLERNEVALAHDIVRELRHTYPAYTVEAIQKKARQSIVGLAKLTSYSLVKITSRAIGSLSLSKTYERLVAHDSSPAIRLIGASIQLDNSGTIPEFGVKKLVQDISDCALAMWILKALVIQHFYLFPVDFRTKQKFCEILQIPYERLQGIEPSRKLIEERKSSQ